MLDGVEWESFVGFVRSVAQVKRRLRQLVS